MPSLSTLASALSRLDNLARPLFAPSTKASRIGPLIAYETLGAPVWSGRDYATFAREGYMSNAVVHRCVRMIAEAAASVPLLLYDRHHELEHHPLLDLLARPTPTTTRADLLAAAYSHLLVSGNAYIEVVALDGVPRELHALRPDRMRVVPGASGWPAAFEYTASGGSVRFNAEPPPGGISPILHLKLFHPLDDHYGHSPIEAAATAIDIHNQASRWNKALLDNAARPSDALVYAAREGRLSPDQFERLKAELQEGFQGAKNAGRPLLLEGGLDWKPISLSPKDMDFIEAKHAAAREIALAIGVPPMLLGIPGDNTYSNYQEATRAFWRHTVLPLVERTAAGLASWLATAYANDGALRLEPDLDQIVALAPEREALWRQIEAATFLTVDEKRAAIGYDPLPLATPAGPHRPFDHRPFEQAPPSIRPTSSKYSPNQPRDERGRWTGSDGDGEEEDDGSTDPSPILIPAVEIFDDYAESDDRSDDADSEFIDVVSRRGPGTATPQQSYRLQAAEQAQRHAVARVRELNPNWMPTPQLTRPGSIEGEIARREAVASEAMQYYQNLVRDRLPWANPSWGVGRLTSELRQRGFEFVGPADGAGKIFHNPVTREEVRIMERPAGAPRRSDPPEKSFNDYYYRWRPNRSQSWGGHTPIPNKE